MNDFSWGGAFFNLGFTIVLYGMFPVLFAALRKNPIKGGTYTTASYMVNIIFSLFVKIAPHIGNGSSINFSFAPYFIWTSLSVAIGTHILEKKKILYSENPKKQMDLANRYICRACAATSSEPVSICPICGDKTPYIDKYIKIAVSPSRRFRCRKCGAEYAQRQEHCNECGRTGTLIERPTIPFVRDSEPDIQASGHIQSATQQQNNSVPTSTVSPGSSLQKETAPVKPITDRLVQVTGEESIPVVKFCRQCGIRLGNGIAVCPKCGTRVIRQPKSTN